jgi:hypothetical protein
MSWDTENKPSGTIDYLLKEDGDYLLLETGDYIILDQSSTFSSEAKPGDTTWTTTNKPS